MNREDYEIPVFGWVILSCLLLAQGIFLFRDAQKRGENPWLWGLWGLLSLPGPALVYLFFVRKIYRKFKKKKR